MITKLTIDGFKSLNQFEISLKEGFNVLIGPNGAGKTNICHAFNLLKSLASNETKDYLLSLGGLNSVLPMKTSTTSIRNTNDNHVNIECEGITKYVIEDFNETPKEVKYKYKADIQLTDKVILCESIIIYKRVGKLFRKILTSTLDEKKQIKLTIHDTKNIGNYRSIEIDKNKHQQTFPIDFSKSPWDESSLLYLSGLFFLVFVVYLDLIDIKTISINPHFAKQHSDILEDEKMFQDGKGLSNELYHLSSNSEFIDDLTSFLKQIIPSFCSIAPETSVDSKRTFALIDKEGIKYPASILSDGTIKAIATYIGLFSKSNANSTIILEEPENYLHPWACNTLIEHIREKMGDNIYLITTHSETILNCMKPEEIIVCMNTGGITQAKRINNTKALNRAIRSTGFGCGYFYTGGSLGGVPND